MSGCNIQNKNIETPTYTLCSWNKKNCNSNKNLDKNNNYNNNNNNNKKSLCSIYWSHEGTLVMSNGRFFKAWKSYTYITSKKGCVHPINEKHACIVLNEKEDLMTYKAGIISQFLNSSALFAYNCRYNSHLNKLLNAENLFLFFFFWLSWRKGLKTLQSLLLDREAPWI